MWIVVWTVVWLTPQSVPGSVFVEQAKPEFVTQEDCNAFLTAHKRQLTYLIALQLGLSPLTQVESSGECVTAGTPA